jgi:hypothetical protein
MSQKGSISENDLMSRLVNAKKVMNKVDNGSFEVGNINRDMIINPEEFTTKSTPSVSNYNTQNKMNETYNIEKIQNSKLPDTIKKAMIENPITQISLNDTLDMDVIKGAKRLMEEQGLSSKPQPITNQKHNPMNGINMNEITSLIENTIRKVLDEKINQILTAQQTTTINESLVLKVGDSIFKGKITGVNKSK